VPFIIPNIQAADDGKSPQKTDLPSILDRLTGFSSRVRTIIQETRALRVTAVEQEGKAYGSPAGTVIDESLAQLAEKTRGDAANKETEWKHAMGELMSEIQRLEICLLKYGPAADRIREELLQLPFRVKSKHYGARAFVGVEDTVLEGLHRFELLVEAMPGALAGVGTIAVEAPRGFEGLEHKYLDLSGYWGLADLTQRQRDCLSMKLEYRLSVRKIAQRLGIHPSGVQDHIRRATVKMNKARLRKGTPRAPLDGSHT